MVLGSSIFHESRAILASTEVRPEPERMAHLITCGLTEADLCEAWRSMSYDVPIMDQTLTEVDSLLPFIQSNADALHARAGQNDVLLFASRDADAIADYYQVAYDSRATSSYLLPASIGLWQSESWFDIELGRAFLRDHGVSEDTIMDASITIDLVDSGFNGTIGKTMDRMIQHLYHFSLREAGRLAILLTSANDYGHGQQIVDIEPDANPRQSFPKTSRLLGDDQIKRNRYSYLPAVALQSMPRYYGEFVDIAQRGDRVVGIPLRHPFARDLDSNRMNEYINPSYNVNPLAAAIAQLRVVRAALGTIDR